MESNLEAKIYEKAKEIISEKISEDEVKSAVEKEVKKIVDSVEFKKLIRESFLKQLSESLDDWDLLDLVDMDRIGKIFTNTLVERFSGK